MKEALFYQKKDNKQVQCDLCPHHCLIPNQGVGRCKVRKNEEGILIVKNYGLLSSIAVDPIEKKPLVAYYPGSKIYSIGGFGCNMHCGFCQNHEISLSYSLEGQDRPVMPQRIISHIKELELHSIAYTYNEPTVCYEWVYETSLLASENGIRNVWVTNGFISMEPLKNILPYIDAMNIDLKTYSPKSYEKLGGKLESVIDTIKIAKNFGVHVEITCLLVPDLYDDLEKCDLFFQELYREIGDTVIHLSRYFPRFHYELPATDMQTMTTLQQLVLQYFSYVKLGNI